MSLNLSPLAKLALQLHQHDAQGLCIEVPSGQTLKLDSSSQGCRIIDSGLEFGSLKDRNKIVAQATFEALRSASPLESKDVFELGFELWRCEIGQSDQASGRLLALASEDLDIIAAGAQQIRAGANAFDVLHLLESALKYVDNLNVGSVAELCLAKQEQTNNDMMAGAFHGVLETWLKTRPDVAKELHSHVVVSFSDATASLLGNAICALAKTNFSVAVELATDDTNSNVILRACVGAWTLGRLLLDENAQPAEIQVLVNEIQKLITTNRGELRSQAVRAAVSVMHNTPAFDKLLEDLAEAGDQDVLCAAASSLFYHADEICERGISKRWFELLTMLKPEFVGAIRDFDYALSRAVATPENAKLVINVLTVWVANFGDKEIIGSNVAELFNDTVRALFANKDYCATLVTDWLLSEVPEHPAAIAGILSQISHNSETKLELEKALIDQLEGPDLVFLARRLLSFVHDRAQLTSLSLSLLNSEDAENRIYPVMRALLVDEIGYDYPGSTVKALRQSAAISTSVSDRELLVHMADTIDRMLEIENALPVRSELRPPVKLRRLFTRARAKQMSDSLAEANKKSVFSQLATEIPIKAGNGTFNYRNASYGASMKLSSLSHSIELPRRESFDPIGNALRHFHFRVAKRSTS